MKAVRFRDLKPSSLTSSTVKARVRASDTKCESVLRKALWIRGLRYRKNVKGLPGCPDIVFSGVRLAIFCDGDFWHGRNWEIRSQKLAKGANAAYWLSKIETNIARDKATDLALERKGWHVMRFWEGDILQDCASIAAKIAGMVGKMRELGEGH